jgi:predicted dehydrogenase
MSTITAGFLGVAHIHTPDFVKRLNVRREAGEVQVKSVWDHDQARAQVRADQMPGASVAATAEDIINDPEITAIVVCAETNRHLDLVLAAAKAKKDLFVEKPLGLGEKDANAMSEAILKENVRFQTGFFMRSQPIQQYIKREVIQGHLGKLTRAIYTNCHGAVLGGWFDTEWNWLTDPKQAGGGALLDLGAHPLDLIISTFSLTEGEIMDAKASVGNRVGRHGTEIDEYGTGLVTFQSGFEAVIAASWDDAGPLHSPIAIHGTEGQFLVQGGQLLYQSKHVDGMDGKTPVPSESMPPAAPHAFEIFWDQLLGKPTPVLPVSPQEAAYGATIMEKLYKSAGKSTTSGL